MLNVNPEHLVVRALGVADAPEFLRVVQSNREHLAQWLDTPSRIHSLGSAEHAMRDVRSNGSPARFGAFHGTELVGAAKVIESRPPDTGVEVGLWVAKAWSGRGVGRWLAASMIEKLRASDDIPVTMRYEIGNESSRRMIEALGMKFGRRFADPESGRTFVAYFADDSNRKLDRP